VCERLRPGGPGGIIGGMSHGFRELAAACAAAAAGNPAFAAEAVVWQAIAGGGREFTPGPLPRGVAPLTPKACFVNAGRTALQRRPARPLSYAEGFALGAGDLWFHHAWNVDDAGAVVDRTWPDPGLRYLGVTVPAGLVRARAGRPMLSEWPIGVACLPQQLGAGKSQLDGAHQDGP
jgi:hypothetical protein